jgi:uncharacterized protein
MITKPAQCPLCGKPEATTTRPFCSQGCKDRDLLNWLGEAYTVPGDPDDSGLDSDGEARL